VGYLGDWMTATNFTLPSGDSVFHDTMNSYCSLPLIKRLTVFYSYAGSDTSIDTRQKYVIYPVHSWVKYDVYAGTKPTFQLEVVYVEVSPSGSTTDFWTSFDNWFRKNVIPMFDVGSNKSS